MITILQHFSEGFNTESLPEEEVFANYSRQICEVIIDDFYSDKPRFDYGKMEFEQMAMIEQILQSGLETGKKYVEVLSWALKGYSNFKIDELRNYFENLPAGACILLFDEIMKSREDILFLRFSGVIYEKPDNTKPKTDESTPTLETNFYKTFGWYDKQKILSKEWNMVFKEVLHEPVEDCLTELAYLKVKNKIEEERMKKSAQK
jgi:hypothetical protein